MSGVRSEPGPAAPPRAAKPLASVSRRSLAWLLDVALVTVLIFVAMAVMDEVFGPTVGMHRDAAALEDVLAADPGRVVLNALLGTLLSASYFVVPWTLLGGSPGQLALRMRVRGSTDGESLPVGRALARWILLFPPFATVSALTAGMPLAGALVWGAAAVWYVVLLLTTARSDTKQGLHDRIAGSVVCNLPRQAAYRAAHVR
jgi:uncharacterized RDD family membrane protein YckC